MTELVPFLPLLLVFGLLSSHFDIKERRVPNWLIAFAISAAVGTHLAIMAKAHVIYGTVNWEYVRDQALNTVFATIIALLLYFGDFAGPADGKMIIAYSLLIPVSAYRKGYYFPYPGIVHIGIAYALAYASVLAVGAKKMSRQDLIEAAKAFFSLKNLVKMLLAIIGLSQLLMVGLGVINIRAGPAATILYTLVIVITLQRISAMVLNGLTGIGLLIYVVRAVSHPEILYLIPKYVLATVILGLIFSPLRAAMKNAKDNSVPMAVFLFVGAIITLLAVS